VQPGQLAVPRRICERLGATLAEIVPLPDNDMYLEGEREKCRYRIDLGVRGTEEDLSARNAKDAKKRVRTTEAQRTVVDRSVVFSSLPSRANLFLARH
jgi:hypothetical protein